MIFAIKIFLFILYFANIAFADIDEFYKKMRKYERRGYLLSCGDSIPGDYIEIDPRPTGGFHHSGNAEVFEIIRKSRGIVIKKETILIDTNNNGIVKTSKEISCDSEHEYIYEITATQHNEKGDLLFSRQYTWINKILVKTIEDGVIRNIISKTPCDYVVIEEPYKDSTFFNFNPKKRITNTSIKDHYRGLWSHKNKFHGKYDVIIYELHSYCKKNSDGMPEPKEIEPIEFSNDSLPYKYYVIFIIGIAVVCVVIIRKRWRRKS